MYTGIVILGRLTCFLESGLPGICEVCPSPKATDPGSWCVAVRRRSWFLGSGSCLLLSSPSGDDPDRDLMVRDKKRGAEAPLTVSLALRT